MGAIAGGCAEPREKATNQTLVPQRKDSAARAKARAPLSEARLRRWDWQRMEKVLASRDEPRLEAEYFFMRGRYVEALAAAQRTQAPALQQLIAKTLQTLDDATVTSFDNAVVVWQSFDYEPSSTPTPAEIDRVVADAGARIAEITTLRVDEPVRIEVLENTNTLARLAGGQGQPQAVCRHGKIMMVVPQHHENWQNLLVHEYAHYLLRRRVGQTLPLWFHEGFATYVAFRVTGDAPAVSPERLDDDAINRLLQAQDKDARSRGYVAAYSRWHRFAERVGNEGVITAMTQLRVGTPWRRVFAAMD